MGFIYPPKVRLLLDSSDLSSIKNPSLREVERQRREAWKVVYDQQLPVERYRSIYIDGNDGGIYVSGINHGKAFGVSVNTIDLINAGHEPLFEIHTHPHNRLFSYYDYLRLIMNASVTGEVGVVKGAIVVCPDVQVMAIATPETLFERPDGIKKFRSRFSFGRSRIGRRVSKISSQLLSIADRPFQERAQMIVDINRKIIEEDKYYSRGLYSEEEFKVFLDNVCCTFSSDFDAFNENYGQTVGQETGSLKSERNRLYLLYDLEVARAVCAKLYIATDFRHFKEFTA